MKNEQLASTVRLIVNKKNLSSHKNNPKHKRTLTIKELLSSWSNKKTAEPYWPRSHARLQLLGQRSRHHCYVDACFLKGLAILYDTCYSTSFTGVVSAPAINCELGPTALLSLKCSAELWLKIMHQKSLFRSVHVMTWSVLYHSRNPWLISEEHLIKVL